MASGTLRSEREDAAERLEAAPEVRLACLALAPEVSLERTGEVLRDIGVEPLPLAPRDERPKRPALAAPGRRSSQPRRAEPPRVAQEPVEEDALVDLTESVCTSNDVPGVNEMKFTPLFVALSLGISRGSSVSRETSGTCSSSPTLSRLMFWRAMSPFEQM